MSNAIKLDGRIEELFHFGEGHNLVEFLPDLGPGHAQHHTVEVDDQFFAETTVAGPVAALMRLEVLGVR